MSDMPDERLRARFAALRRDEAAGAPLAAPMLAARSARRPGWRLTGVAWAGLAAAAVLAAFAGQRAMRARADARAAAEVARALGPFYGEWRSPTDALLETPGHHWLAAVPQIGTIDSLAGPRPIGGQP